MGALSTSVKPARTKCRGWLILVLMVGALSATGPTVAAVAAPTNLLSTGASAQDDVTSIAACKVAKVLRDAAGAILDPDDPTTWPAAKRLYEQVIANGSPRARACAAVQLAQLLQREKEHADAEAKDATASSSWEQKLQKSWAAWNKAHRDPLKDIVPTAAGLAFLLLLLARLVTGALVRPDYESPREWVRRMWWTTGLVLITLSAVSLPLALSVDVKDGARWPMIVLVATALLVAALLVPRRERRWGRPESVVTVAGIAAMVLATPTADLRKMLPGADLPDADLVLIAGAWAGVVGVVLMAVARGLALAIEVQVRGASGSDNTSHARMLVARLQELGSESPRDIRMLSATDVTSLPEDALTAVPNGAWATALFNVLKVLRPAAPWRVTVTQPDASTMVMDITRNRVAVEKTSLVVGVAEIPAAPPPKKANTETGSDTKDTASASTLDELLTIAAARTLLALAGPHRNLRVGLCGADSWQALGFHAISRRAGVSADRKSELLHAAIDASPNYLVPRMAVVNLMDDRTPDGRLLWAKAIDRLWTHFEGSLEPQGSLDAVADGYEAAQLRMLYNRAVAWMNVRTDRAVAKAQPLQVQQAWRRSAKAAIGLHHRLESLREHPVPGLEALREDSRRPATFLILDLAKHPAAADSALKRKIAALAGELAPNDVIPEPQTRNDYYARACYYASLHGDEDKWALALLDLEVAATASRFAEWAPHDPSLVVFTGRNELDERADDKVVEKFKELVAASPPASFLDLPMFQPHAAALKGYGLTDIDHLRSVPLDDLAAALKVHPSVAERWISAAQLTRWLAARGETDDSVRLQLLGLLLGLKVGSPSDLKVKMRGNAAAREKFYREMVKSAADMRIVPTRGQTIERWQ